MEELLARFQSGFLSAAYVAVEDMIDDQITALGTEVGDQLCDWAESDEQPWNDEAVEKLSYLFAGISEQIDYRQSEKEPEEETEELTELKARGTSSFALLKNPQPKRSIT